MPHTVRSAGRYSSRPTTQELFESAPESVSARRHRLRAEREEAARRSSGAVPTDKQQLSDDEEECEDRVAESDATMGFTVYGKEHRTSTKSIELIDVALDRRPGVPLLVSLEVVWEQYCHFPALIPPHAHTHTHTALSRGNQVFGASWLLVF